MRNRNLLFATLVLTFLWLPNNAKEHENKNLNYLDLICKKWVIESLAVNDCDKKLTPPIELTEDYLDYRKDGTFTLLDDGKLIQGKWKVDYKKMQIINYNITNLDIYNDFVFRIVEISKNKLIISRDEIKTNLTCYSFKPSSN